MFADQSHFAQNSARGHSLKNVIAVDDLHLPRFHDVHVTSDIPLLKKLLPRLEGDDISLATEQSEKVIGHLFAPGQVRNKHTSRGTLGACDESHRWQRIFEPFPCGQVGDSRKFLILLVFWYS